MDLKTYREKKNEVHTPEEIKEAFDTSFAMSSLPKQSFAL